MSEYLQCIDVTKSFGALKAVNNMSFSVAKGEILGITGPNGAGKTTLFEAISGFNPATSGTVLLEGEDITNLAPHRICHRGMMRVFQSTAVFGSLPAWQNILIGQAFGRPDRSVLSLARISAADRQKCMEALETVDLADKAEAPVSELTVLERKFLMIASALVTDPKILLLDEPVGGLTEEEIEAVFQMLNRLRGDGATILLIEHVMRFMVRIADRVLVMHHGELIFDDLPSELAHNHTVRAVYLGEAEAERLATDTVGEPQ